jgi:hypothetical protein
MNPATVICTGRTASGAVIPNAINTVNGPPSLPPLGHWAGYNFRLLMGQRGTIDCTSTTNVAATALRFLGNKAFSSLSVIDKGVVAAPNGAALPQFAAQDVWNTGIFAINTSSVPANFSIAFRQGNTTLQPLTFAIGATSTTSSLAATLPANGSGYYETGNPSGPLVSG